MHKYLAYIRKNIVFVSLLSALLCITVVFSVYLLMNRESIPSAPPVVNPPVEVDRKAKITSLEGSYSKSAQVDLSWSIDPGDRKVIGVKLYQGDRQLGGDMSNLTSYSFAQNIYQFPTGNVTFTLKVILEGGEEISEDVDVFISYVLDIKMEIEYVEDGVLLKLSYQYDNANTATVPKVKMLNIPSNQTFEFSYVDTTKQTNGNLVRATTTYKVGTAYVASGSYNVNIRWIFDGLNISKDFPVTITKK